MTSIVDLFGLTHPLRRVSPESQVKKVSNPDSVSKGESVEKSALPNSDKVSISGCAKNLLIKETEVFRYLNQIQNIVPLDEKAIEEIRQRIEEGCYEEPAVISKIIADIASPPPFQDNIIDSDASKIQDLTQEDDSLETIKNKIQQGVYLTKKVTEHVIDKMLNSDYI